MTAPEAAALNGTRRPGRHPVKFTRRQPHTDPVAGTGVLRGWLIGPGAALTLGYGITWLVAVTAGTSALLAAG